MKKWTIVCISLLVLVFAVSASADTISLNMGNSAMSGFTGPCVSVVVDLTDSTHATFTFTSDKSGGYEYLMTSNGAAAVNINAASFTLSGLTNSNSIAGFSAGPVSDGGAGQEDGFGNFNLTINSFDSFMHSNESISFTVTNTSGTWASAANVLAANSNGWSLAAHIGACPITCSTSKSFAATGYATGTPEPASLALLGTGLLALGGLVRRRVGGRG